MSRVLITIGRGVRGIVEAFHGSRISLSAVLAILAIIVLSCGIACPDAHAQSPKKLIVAESPSWSTQALVANSTAVPFDVSFATCLVTGASATLLPGDAYRLDHVGRWQCGVPNQFYVLPEQPGAKTLVQFDDGHTKASYELPAVGALEPNGWLRMSPVTNDAAAVLHLNAFAEKPTRIFVKFFDGHNKPIAEEFCDAAPPVTQCGFKTQIGIGSVELTNPGYVTAPARVYGFLSVTAPDGGNARVYPF